MGNNCKIQSSFKKSFPRSVIQMCLFSNSKKWSLKLRYLLERYGNWKNKSGSEILNMWNIFYVEMVWEINVRWLIVLHFFPPLEADWSNSIKNLPSPLLYQKFSACRGEFVTQNFRLSLKSGCFKTAVKSVAFVLSNHLSPALRYVVF